MSVALFLLATIAALVLWLVSLSMDWHMPRWLFYVLPGVLYFGFQMLFRATPERLKMEMDRLEREQGK
ncbi:hypothetical protein LH462_06780 [Laribacter hongkongensis]|uniref:Uncharacterized protein n=1 Tax=Laribacter hongkongensis TaxID=168471 RepID=A0ABD4SR18_9NEIS|nr:hypothetical protein [Laribacter hongkongensis]MCG9025185.1 hypothetical protein [Laribacter hongkongensis]MCG9099773.1 hypothetical protein [Laribacter hongkongensis]MCG9103425.1 hypothetical protein [Laribacter hongkongensis]MCG9111251.1 hypothetical protein [Laribacter hongkongensis]MCG9118593.1 hypothetical protein [Laribacter hongkongensis]